MVFKTVILSVRELKSKNSNCLSGHSPQPREPGLPDCLQRLLSHCVLFKVRKHTHTDHVTPQRSDVCEGLMTLHLFYAHSNLPEDSWRRLRVCASACACQSGPLHLIMCIIMGVLSSSFLVVTSCQSYHWTLTFDLGPPEVGQSIIFCENLVLSFPPPDAVIWFTHTTEVVFEFVFLSPPNSIIMGTFSDFLTSFHCFSTVFYIFFFSFFFFFQ